MPNLHIWTNFRRLGFTWEKAPFPLVRGHFEGSTGYRSICAQKIAF